MDFQTAVSRPLSLSEARALTHWLSEATAHLTHSAHRNAVLDHALTLLRSFSVIASKVSFAATIILTTHKQLSACMHASNCNPMA